MEEPHKINVVAAFPSTNQNGTENIILQLDRATLPCHIRKALETWWTLDVAVPDFHASLIIGHHTLQGSDDRIIQEPILYHGTVRFDCSPCEPGRDCPNSVFMILPISNPPEITSIIVLSLVRNRTPPCF